MKLFFKAFLFINFFFFKFELYRLGLSAVPLGVLTRKGVNVCTFRVTFNDCQQHRDRSLYSWLKNYRQISLAN